MPQPHRHVVTAMMLVEFEILERVLPPGQFSTAARIRRLDRIERLARHPEKHIANPLRVVLPELPALERSEGNGPSA
jgi:hypothetical protein